VPIESQVVDPRASSCTARSEATRLAATADRCRSATELRRFLAYFRSGMANTEVVHDLQHWVWTLQVSAAADPTLAIAVRGARRTTLVLAAGALALGIGLMIIVRATRAAAAVASMRSEFVSTVTHELKTPMSVIQSIGETMARPRGLSRQQRERATAGAGDLPAAAPHRQSARLRSCHRGCGRLFV
jgi:signal transduction histidine kinase